MNIINASSKPSKMTTRIDATLYDLLFILWRKLTEMKGGNVAFTADDAVLESVGADAAVPRSQATLATPSPTLHVFTV